MCVVSIMAPLRASTDVVSFVTTDVVTFIYLHASFISVHPSYRDLYVVSIPTRIARTRDKAQIGSFVARRSDSNSIRVSGNARLAGGPSR